MIEIENDDFGPVIGHSAEGLAVAYFTAPWCGPCRMLKPVLEQLEAENREEFAAGTRPGVLTVARIDVENNTELARTFQIMSVPTMILYHFGQPVDEVINGIKPKSVLRETFNQYLND